MSGPSTEGVALVERLHRLWSTGDKSLIAATYHVDFVAYWPPSAAVPIRRGRDAVERGVDAIRGGFPDWEEHVEDIFGVDDRVADRFRSTGTHRGSFAGIERTGNCVDFMELGLYRIADGLIIEQWCLFDEVARLRQLDVDGDYAARLIRGG
jgi:ketosteroid isomerase-like protein